ncbi:MAG: PAS domain S-box protein [Pseudomonadota bacterium]
MKIRDKLQITFITIALSFGVIGFIEHQYIAEIADSFSALETQKAPSLTALLEMTAATRRASIKAMEYSMRGESGDRRKAFDALQQIDQEFERYQALSTDREARDISDLLARKEQLTNVISDFLMISEGPAIVQMISEQEVLHQARSSLIGTIKELMPKAPEPLKYDLLLIKSEARKVSIKLVEYTLRGNAADQQKALDAMQELRSAQIKYAAADSTTLQRAGPVTRQVTAYLSAAEHYLQQMSSRQYAVQNVYAKEEELHTARKALIRALYPLIEHHYEKLGQASDTTWEDIRTAGRLQIYSVVLVTLIAIIFAVLLARSISTPLVRLSSLVNRFGQGESIATEDIPTSGAQELRRLSNAIVGMMREREILEESLKSSEAFVRMLFETSPVGLALTRMDGALVEINPAYATTIGRSVEETLCLAYWDITPEEYNEQEQAQLESLSKTGRYGPYEKEYLHKDGHRIPVRLSGLLIERNGEPHIWSVVEDITEQRQAAAEIERQLAALSITEHKLAEAQRVAHVGNWELDLLSNELWWSDEVFRIFEIDRELFSGTYKGFLDTVHPEDRGEVNRVYSESVQNRTPYDIIHRLLMSDGRIKHVHQRCETYYDETGNALRSIGTVQDITDYHRAQEALRENEQRLTLLLNTLPHGVEENNTEGVITYSNLAHHRILGWKPGELIGRHIWDSQIDDPQKQELREYLVYLVKEQPLPEPFITRNVTKDGREILVEITWDYLRDSEGTLKGFISVISDITESKQAEIALAVSEERFRNLVESSQDWIWEINAKGIYTYASPRCQSLLGYSPDEIVGRAPFELMSAAETQRVREDFLRIITAHAPIIALENTNRCKDGREVVLETSGIPFFDSDGQLAGYRGIDRDVTERKRVEQALYISKTNLAEAQKIAQLGSWELDSASSEFYWSDQEYLCLGYPIQTCEASYENLLQAVHPDDRKRVNSTIQAVLRGELDTCDIEHRVTWQDGSERVLHERAFLERGADGNPLRIIGTSQDITQRVRMEKELEAHRKHLEVLVEERTSTIKLQAQIIDQTHDSVVTTDLDGFVTSWNGGAKRLFGTSTEDAIGQHISFVYPESQHELLEEQIIAPLKEHGLLDTEVKMSRADGSEFPAHISLSLLYNDDGEPRGMVGYSIDMSELKRREIELDRLANRLQVANKELESFSYSVSHDLRAPLRAIDGFSLAMVEDYGNQLDETAHDYLQRVRSGAQRMGILIDDMLQLSRVNRKELQLTEVDLGEVAEAVLEELKASKPGRQLAFTHGEDLWVKGDARLLRVMLDNLLGNAWKFTSREAISKIVFQRLPDAPEIFTIRDNGVGFDMRYADKLFGAFQRLHRVTDFPGTGVGLATVQRIIHRHGGKIWAEAQEDEGATFYFTLEGDGNDTII